MFFEVIPRCFRPLGKFHHNIEISIKTAHNSGLSVSFGYGKTEKNSDLLYSKILILYS